MLTFLAIAVWLMACFDARLTMRRLRDYGESVENNPVVRYFSTQSGPELAALAGIVFPNTIIVATCFTFGLKTFLAALFGFKIRYFYNQLLSLKWEKEAKEMTKYINSRRD